MKQIQTIICLFLFTYFSNGSWANNLCPLNFETQQSSSIPPPGYQIAEDWLGAHRLTYVEVYDGPVKGRVSLAPEEQENGDSRWVFAQWSEQRGVEVAVTIHAPASFS